ncbi:hypothetical protein BS78_04G262400 [Paspalum vaginatum]|nr:hypothetical protein BS78_04G262400 [Paspalum vaginatum]
MGGWANHIAAAGRIQAMDTWVMAWGVTFVMPRPQPILAVGSGPSHSNSMSGRRPVPHPRPEPRQALLPLPRPGPGRQAPGARPSLRHPFPVLAGSPLKPPGRAAPSGARPHGDRARRGCRAGGRPVRPGQGRTRESRSSISLVYHSWVAAMLRNFPQARRLLRRMGFEKEDAYFWKQMSKAMLCTYTLLGVAWIWNETSPLGWWTLKPRPKEEKEMAHLYERRKFPYPGDEEAVEEFIKGGGALGTTIGPRGFADANMDSENMQKQLQSKKFEQEAQKLWLRMRNEVIQELQEKGFDIE